MSTKAEKISIVGSGLIGRSFAMLFASAGYRVCIYDVEKMKMSEALIDIKKQLNGLEASGTLKGNLTAAQQLDFIQASDSLEDCLRSSIHVQECVPENLQLKIEIFNKMDAIAGPDTVLSSSTSCILPSKFTKDLVNRTNCIVSHPYNPPYYVPAIEVVPAPWTTKNVMQRTCTLLKQIGLIPIKFCKESIGFGSNRIQYAILNECWHLVKDGILGVEDVDNLMKHGLAMRYAWCGPFETIHLNAEGVENYIERYGPTINSVSQTYKPPPSWKVEEAKEIIKELNDQIPLDQLQKQRALRDARLTALSKLKKQLKEKKD